LSLSRAVFSTRVSHGLKSWMHDLGREPVGAFKELFKRPKLVARCKVKKHKERRCSCGTDGCRKRVGHSKTVVEWEEQIEEVVQHGYEITPLTEIVASSGHPMFPVLVKYAAEDAEAALELEEYLTTRRIANTPMPVPWGGR
jgi:hypothetical protein